MADERFEKIEKLGEKIERLLAELDRLRERNRQLSAQIQDLQKRAAKSGTPAGAGRKERAEVTRTLDGLIARLEAAEAELST